MKSSLPILVALWTAALPAALVAQEGDAARPLTPPSATYLLEQASLLMARHRSVSAKIRHQARIYDREIIGTGVYAQGPGSSRLMRYELQLQVGQNVVQILQVNDGRYLWRKQQFDGDPEVERIDVDAALASAMANGIVRGPEAVGVLGLGGLGRILETLRKDFDFGDVFQSELGGLAVYGMEGRWKPKVLEALGVDSAAKLRPHVPDRVVVYLGCDDLFLYRLDYSRAEEKGRAGEGSAEDVRRLLKMELHAVQFNSPLDEALFQFDSGARQVLDVTERTIQARPAVP